MNRWLDCIQIWYGCSLGISDDLINFWDESIKNKMAAAAIQKNFDMIVVGGGGIFFSLFLDINGQSLRLRGPAISWWLFLHLNTLTTYQILKCLNSRFLWTESHSY